MDVAASFYDYTAQLNPQISDSDLSSECRTSLPKILHRILLCDGPDLLPLRTMFSFNSGQRLPKLVEVYQWWSFDPKGRSVIEFLSRLERITPCLDDTPLQRLQFPPSGPVENISADHAPADRFMDANNDRLLDFEFPQVSDLAEHRESRGLPPDFVGNLCLNRIFTSSWEGADLKHALTGLDYLSNLEGTRRNALRDAAQRLHINEHTWRTVLSENATARAWVSTIQEQEERIDGYYALIWLDLRIWTMMKELKSVPFYKPNVIAMLNTLFPPALKELPSMRVAEKTLHKYRSSFYRFIVSIEKNGNTVLDGFIEKLSRHGTHHTWQDTRQTLKDYIALADMMIKGAVDVHSISYFKNNPDDSNFQAKSKRTSGTVSELSNRASISSSANTSCAEMKRSSTKSSGQGDKLGSVTSSVRSGRTSITSQDLKCFPVPRSKVSGRPLAPKITNHGDVDTIFQETPPAPWYLGPRRPSIRSRQAVVESGSASTKLRSGSFSHPSTPSIEQQTVHRRGSSAGKRTSYDFRAALPGTPEFPNPHDGHGPDTYMGGAEFWEGPAPKNGSLMEDGVTSENLAARAKKPAFSFLHRKKKFWDGKTQKRDFETEHQFNSSKSLDSPQMTTENHSPSDRRTVKKKSSFGFLQSRKSGDGSRGRSDNDSERTITDGKVQSNGKLKHKRSFPKFFANKETGLGNDSFNSNDEHSENGKAPGSANLLYPALRKVRSWSSVKSSSSTKSVDGMSSSSMAGTPNVGFNDRVITSADIAEPFPFGNFVQPQQPAAAVESTMDNKAIEELRLDLIEKSIKERKAKWDKSEDLKRKLEASQQKRKIMREESEPNSQVSKAPKQKKQEEKQRQKEKKERAREYKEKQKEEEEEGRKYKQTAAQTDPTSPISRPQTSDKLPKTPKTPSCQQTSDKPPKTPLKERILHEIAMAYSPTPH